MRKAEIEMRQVQALELRQLGVEYEEIARQVGFSDKAGAHKAVMRALDRRATEPTEQVRQMELARLDQMYRALGTRILRGDDKAIRSALAIMDRRARLLGLDAPIKHEVVTIDAITAEIDRLERELGPAGREAVEAVRTAGAARSGRQPEPG